MVLSESESFICILLKQDFFNALTEKEEDLECNALSANFHYINVFGEFGQTSALFNLILLSISLSITDKHVHQLSEVEEYPF